MKLEVGKSYRRRDGGGPVNIILKTKCNRYPFVSDTSVTYTENGHFNWYLTENDPKDLVAEWGEPEGQTEAGKLLNDLNKPKPAKPDWYWGFWEWNYKFAVENEYTILKACEWADAACAERMKREEQ